jgi:hypothetical protein
MVEGLSPTQKRLPARETEKVARTIREQGIYKEGFFANFYAATGDNS